MKSDALLAQVRACRMGVILGGDPADPAMLGVRISDMPPGRAQLVRRNQKHLVQVAHIATNALPSWVARLSQTQAMQIHLEHVVS